MTTELLSLLLTGTAHSTFENWSADPFGIGLLRTSKTVTAPRLLRPIKPIWLCQGDLGYSMLFLENDSIGGADLLLESPGRVLPFAHWNCWSGDRTGFRVVTSMRDAVPYKVAAATTVISDSEEQEGRTVTESISTNLRLEYNRDAAMPSWSQDGIFGAASGASTSRCVSDPNQRPITDEELELVSFHPDDDKYYPGQFRRWRFYVGSCPGDNGSVKETAFATMSSPANPAAGKDWVPFYRLRGRQRLIVEMKLAPRICGIVRSRWPLATVRDFTTVGNVPVL